MDTSALIPLVIEEPGSQRAGRAWDAAEHVTSVRLIYAETRAALAQAGRLGWLGAAQLLATVEALDGLYDQLDLIDTDAPLVRRAGELAQRHSLPGYDAIHLAAAERIAGPTTVLVAGDRDLCAAARALGIAVADTSLAGPDE